MIPIAVISLGVLALVPLALLRKGRRLRPRPRLLGGVPRAASSWRGGAARGGN